MASTTTTPTTLTQSVNIILANIGEAPVNSVAGSVPQQVSLALNTLTEVSRDVQSKGWWFNQQSGGNYSESANITLYDINVSNDWNTNIPEEAVRYITIRAARIANSRFIGAEELQKFSLNEELVSLAILQQAHVRNSNGVLDFNSFPSELKSLGVDEVMFLQGNVEEKYGTLRLASEVVNQAKTKAETELLTAQELKTDAETTLVTAQELQVDAQTATEGSRKLDIEADTTLKGKQGLLVDAQELKTDAETTLITAQELKVDAETATEGSRKLDVEADTTLKGKQGSLVDAQELKTDAETATEGSRKLDIEADTTLKGKQGALVDAQELKTDAETATEGSRKLDIEADTTLKGKQGALVDAQELKTDAETATEGSRKLDVEADTTLKGKQGLLVDAQELKTDAETATEGSRKLDIEADTTLKGKQGLLVDAQELKTDAETATEGSRKLDIEADTTLKGKQGLLIDAQELKTDAETELLTAQELKTDAEKELIDAQELKTDAEAALIADQEALIEQQKLELSEKRTYETNAESAWFQNGGVAITGESGYFSFKDFKEELRMMGIQEGPFNGLPAYKKVELIKDAHQLRANVTQGVSESGSTNLKLVNSILRLIGEHKVANVNENALAVTAYDLMVETNEELQSRGWYFNTTHDYEFTATNQGIISISNISPEVLNVEINNVRTRQDFSNSNYIYNLEDQSYTTWSGTVKGTIIQRVSLASVPVKYRQYLEVRVAILLTEMYPKSGVDIQRLPKMEAELRAYFADVDNDNANYSIFDNYDTYSRVGINRNYEL